MAIKIKSEYVAHQIFATPCLFRDFAKILYFESLEFLVFECNNLRFIGKII